jgi:hypothetical protein
MRSGKIGRGVGNCLELREEILDVWEELGMERFYIILTSSVLCLPSVRCCFQSSLTPRMMVHMHVIQLHRRIT